MIRRLRALIARLAGLPPCPTCGRATVSADEDGFLLCQACVFGTIVQPPAHVDHPMIAVRKRMACSANVGLFQSMFRSASSGEGSGFAGTTCTCMRYSWPNVEVEEAGDE